MVAAFAMQANAHLNLEAYYELDAVIGNPAEEADWIETELSLAFDLSYLNKYNYGGGGWDGGGEVDDANFSVDPLAGEPTQADIEWDLTGTGFTASYVLVKDGRDNGKFLYSLYSVSADQSVVGGPDTVQVNADADKAISHIAWYGVPGSGGPTVPDGGTAIVLLGMGLVGMAALRRSS